MLERPQATDGPGREDPVRATAQRDASTAPASTPIATAAPSTGRHLDAIAAAEKTRKRHAIAATPKKRLAYR